MDDRMWCPQYGKSRICLVYTFRWRLGRSRAVLEIPCPLLWYTAPTPLPGKSAAHAASAALNSLRQDRNRPRNCWRQQDSQVLAQGARCGTIPPSATVSGPVGPVPAKLLQPAMTAIDQGLRHDSAFKLFVHHQSFIRHLLRAYPPLGIDEREVVAIDAGNANLVAPHGQGQRLADAVWRLTLADGEIAYLLIECQAEIDPSMPFRMLHAAAGLYLILSQNPPRGSGYAASFVPRVKHLIIYSGKRPWTAAGEVEQAIQVRSLQEERDIPRMQCPLLELWRCPDPGGEENLAVLLGRLQPCGRPRSR